MTILFANFNTIKIELLVNSPLSIHVYHVLFYFVPLLQFFTAVHI